MIDKEQKEITKIYNELKSLMRMPSYSYNDTHNKRIQALYAIYKQKLEEMAANAKLTAKEREIELSRRAADSNLYVRTKEADALKVEADAETYRAEQGTELMKAQRLTIQEEAEAKLYMRTKEAEAEEKKIAANRYAEEQELQIVKMRGLAEVDVLKAKKLAEAEGIEAKGNAMSNYGQAAMLEMVVGVLPEIAKSMAGSPDIDEKEILEKVMAFVQEATGMNVQETLLANEQKIETEEK